MEKHVLLSVALVAIARSCYGQYNGDFSVTRAEVDFSKVLRHYSQRVERLSRPPTAFQNSACRLSFKRRPIF